MSDFATICEQAARAGGEVLLGFRGQVTVQQKAPKDLVTEADFAAQRTIKKILLDAYPAHDFLGEEDSALEPERGPDGAYQPTRCEYRWIVDPLDGTTNYVHQLNAYAVSVALQRHGQVIVGTVYDPVMQECFTAKLGCGATLNGQPIATSRCCRLADALVAASFSPNVRRGSLEITRFTEVLYACHAVRRLGSAALNLAYVAAGRLDAYWATSVKSWDVAAGLLLVTEAGGVVSNVEGKIFDLAQPNFAAASTGLLHRELVEILRLAAR